MFKIPSSPAPIVTEIGSLGGIASTTTVCSQGSCAIPSEVAIWTVNWIFVTLLLILLAGKINVTVPDPSGKRSEGSIT